MSRLFWREYSTRVTKVAHEHPTIENLTEHQLRELEIARKVLQQRQL